MVDVGRQSDAGARAQDLGGVAPRGAPCVQGEGEEAQAQVEGDDEEWGVAGSQVEGVDQVQRWQEEQQDQGAVQDTSNYVLQDSNTETETHVKR